MVYKLLICKPGRHKSALYKYITDMSRAACA